MKSSFLVIVFLAVFATVQSESDILTMLRKWLLGGSNVSNNQCTWGSGEQYPVFQFGQEIEMLDGCYSCRIPADSCEPSCQLKSNSGKCQSLANGNGACQWSGSGLPKYDPRKDIYKDDCHSCQFGTVNCNIVCKDDCSNADKKILALIKELRED